MRTELLFLGIDGGGTRSRARLCNSSGATLGEGVAGPANIRLGLEESFAAILDASRQSMAAVGLTFGDVPIVACLALAGASEPAELAAAQRHKHPFRRAVITTDAHAACVGAHSGADGGVIIIGTGAVGWAVLVGRQHRVGGWGFPISDEGSGAWLGCEAIRRALWAYDGRIPDTDLLRRVLERFNSDPHAIVRWMTRARPRDYAMLAPLVIEHAERGDPVGVDLMREAAGHIDALAGRLEGLGAERIALAGGLAPSIEPWLGRQAKSLLIPPLADALAGAVRLAEAAAAEIEPAHLRNDGVA